MNKEVEIYNKWFKDENYTQATILNAIKDGLDQGNLSPEQDKVKLIEGEIEKIIVDLQKEIKVDWTSSKELKIIVYERILRLIKTI